MQKKNSDGMHHIHVCIQEICITEQKGGKEELIEFRTDHKLPGKKVNWVLVCNVPKGMAKSFLSKEFNLDLGE